jgi:hypothetical protein
LSQARADHREWIGGRAVTLLSHYWRDDDPVELTAAIGRDWADVLEGLPQDAIHKACIQFQRDEPRRKPTPAAIYALARAFMPPPVIVPKRPIEEPARERMTADRANQILAEVGFRPKRMGDAE